MASQPDVYIESVRGQLALQTLGPFNDGSPGLQGLIQSDLIGLIRTGQAIEIEMGHRQIPALIELDQGKGGGGDLLLRRGQGPDQGPGQGGFPGPQGTGQAQGLTRLQGPGQGKAQGRGRGLVGQVYAKD